MNQSAHSEPAWRTSWPNTKEFSPVLAKGHTTVTSPHDLRVQCPASDALGQRVQDRRVPSDDRAVTERFQDRLEGGWTRSALLEPHSALRREQ